MQDTIVGWCAKGWVAPRTCSEDLLRHVYRENNSEADELTKQAMRGRDNEYADEHCLQLGKPYIRVDFDGGYHQEKQKMTIGWPLGHGARKDNGEE